MFDINKTLGLVKGAMFDPEATWDSYFPEAGDWKRTAFLLTGPLVIASGVLSYIVSLIFPSRFPFVPTPTLAGALTGIIIGALAALVIAFVFAFLAGLFKGKNSFPLALAATSLAFVPGYVGQVLMHIPWIGGLLSLGLGIYGLVLLWKILPRYLEVPATSHTGHYILSLVGSIVVLLVLGATLGGGIVGDQLMQQEYAGAPAYTRGAAGGTSSTGAFAGMERMGRLMEEAESDTYDPPRNGQLSRAQVQAFVDVMTRTRDYMESQAKALEDLSNKAEKGESASWSDAMSGLAGVASLSTAEMEVVKTGGGNWAEHRWVKEQLHVARIQKDINPAVKHNYELYQEFQQQLDRLGQW